jgi:hypothetical protein
MHERMKHILSILFLISIGCSMLGATDSALLSIAILSLLASEILKKESSAEIPMEPTLAAKLAVSFLIHNLGGERSFLF